MGIDRDGARRGNADAITICLSGYGATGPFSSFLSYGPVLQAHAGFDEATGYDASTNGLIDFYKANRDSHFREKGPQ